ncbi:ADP,ATP carrier protein, mitochondrial [Capsicum chinense]|nr:ADP,ATP carrier protein, mitochondrial [Capsicum chinense]
MNLGDSKVGFAYFVGLRVNLADLEMHFVALKMCFEDLGMDSETGSVGSEIDFADGRCLGNFSDCLVSNFKKNRDGYWTWFSGNLASGGAAGASSLFFVYSLDYARTRIANDAKAAKKGGERQFNGMIDIYRKTLSSDGVAGLYRVCTSQSTSWYQCNRYLIRLLLCGQACGDKSIKASGNNLSMITANASPVFVKAPAEKGVAAIVTDFLMGGVSAALSKTATAPIKRVKLLIQNQDEMIKTGRLSELYNGNGDCFNRTMQDEEAVVLWRRNIANVIRYSLLRIVSRDSSTSRRTVMHGYCTWFAGNLASSGAAGASSLFFVYSLDYARTHLANDAKAAKKGGERRFNGMIYVYRKTLSSDGVAGLYRGFNISCVGIIVYRVDFDNIVGSTISLGLYGCLQDSFFVSFALGWVITNGAGLASYPIDTVRRRKMMTSGEAVKYKSSLHAFSQILKSEGPISHFIGAGGAALPSCCCWI